MGGNIEGGVHDYYELLWCFIGYLADRFGDLIGQCESISGVANALIALEKCGRFDLNEKCGWRQEF